MYDVVVIGGNISGATAAIHAAEKGVSVALVERNKEPFSPAHCGEGIDDVTAKWLNLEKMNCTCNKIKNIIVNISSLKEYTINLKKHRLVIFDRNYFEKSLLDKADKLGVKLICRNGLKDFKPPHEIILDNNMRVNGRIIIDASGIACQIGRRIGINTKLKREDIGVCIQSRVQSSFDSDTIRTWFHKPYAPFGYAWVFPINESTANIGIGIPGDQKQELHILLKNFIEDMTHGNYKITNTFRACVPSAMPLSTLVKDNVIIVGDAARLANPTSGSGIISSILSGGLAGKIAAEYVNGKTVSLELFQYLMRRKILMLKKIYMKKIKLNSETKFIKSYNRFFKILYIFHRLAPNILETRIEKIINRDISLMENYS